MAVPGTLRPLLSRCSFPPPSPAEFPCAVSGGADSLALLALAAAAGCSPVAYHVDHGLRSASSDEAEIVRRAADRLGVQTTALSVEVGDGPNLEARAREARYGVLPDNVATGHTADDQAETILINLLRGSATDGLAGMRPGVRHPLLSIRRSETRQVCMAAGLSWFEDPSNRDGRHLRNRVRHELLPWLSEAASRDMVPLLCRQAGLLAADAALLDELSASLDVTDARALAGSPAPLARRAVRRWLRAELGGYPPSAAAVERVLTVAAGRVVGSEVSRGLSVRRSGGRLRLEHGRPGGKERTPTVN